MGDDRQTLEMTEMRMFQVWEMIADTRDDRDEKVPCMRDDRQTLEMTEMRMFQVWEMIGRH